MIKKFVYGNPIETGMTAKRKSFIPLCLWKMYETCLFNSIKQLEGLVVIFGVIYKTVV